MRVVRRAELAVTRGGRAGSEMFCRRIPAGRYTHDAPRTVERLRTKAAATLMLALVAVALAVTLRPFSAHGDWQYTRWGMTVEEVVAASAGVAHAYSKDLQKSYRGFDNLAAAPYEASGFSFTARFMFSPEDRRLTGVDLDVANSKCADLEGALRSRYGVPEAEQNTFVHSLFTWRDITDGNQVSLLRLGSRLTPDYCSLRYRPLVWRGL
jgi:hypothetical protein